MSVVQVKKTQVMYDPHTRESRGFGFVTMETGEEADVAITAMNGTELMGKTVSVEKVRLALVFHFLFLISSTGSPRSCPHSDSWSLLRAPQAQRQ